VVTPSFNQGDFIEATIRSVLLQGYPDLEYIVIDGGSTDRTVEVIKRYAPWLSSWVSEKDRGQAHAINKGFDRATGEVVAWLNSDDLYLPGALQRAAGAFAEHAQVGIVHGDALQRVIGSEREGLLRSEPLDTFVLMRIGPAVPQPAVFVRRSVLQAAGPIDEAMHFAFDYDLWLRCSLVAPFLYLGGPPLAVDVRHPGAKGNRLTHLFWPDIRASWSRFLDRPDAPDELRASRRRWLAHAYHQDASTRLLLGRGVLEAAAVWRNAVALHPGYLLRGPAALIRWLVKTVFGRLRRG
jgi:glycosyltransferase involved in cell wall biosynthesis